LIDCEDNGQTKKEESNNNAEMFFKECIEHIKTHKLYSEALRIFSGTPKYKAICELYADHCFATKLMTQASIFYQKSGNIENAAKCMLEDLDYTNYIQLVHSTSVHSPEEMNINLGKIATDLEMQSNFDHASKVLLHIDAQGNADKIVNCYVKSGKWVELILFTKKMTALDTNNVQKFLNDRVETLCESILNWKKSIESHYARLYNLSSIKLNKLKELIDDGTLFQNDVSEISDISDVSTCLSSSQTSRASKMKKKKKKQMERKKRQIKEGSQYEDSAILSFLKDSYKEVDTLQDEIGELLHALVYFDKLEQGKKVQSEFISLINYLQSLLPRIWPEVLEPNYLVGPIRDMYRNDEGIVIAPQSEAELMPLRLRLDECLFPPILRNMCAWKLDLFT